MGRGTRKLAVAVLVLTLAVVYLAVGLADAEQSGHDGVVVSFNAELSPKVLPRNRVAPVSISLAGRIVADDSVAPRRLRRIELAFGTRGGLDTVGLPRCPRAELRASDLRHALAACGPALVGRGSIAARMELDGQKPSDIHAHLLAFNGRTAAGQTAVWVLVYPYSPALPASIVLPFYLKRLPPGAYGLLFRAPVEESQRRRWRLVSFRITLGRRYRSGGEIHSYLNAHCPLPPRFDSLNIPLARATYYFVPAPTITTTILRACRVRD